MFITTVLLTLALIVYISIRHWMRAFRLSARSVQKTLREIPKLIALNQLDEARNALLPLLHHEKGGQQAHLYYVQVLRGTRAYDEALHCVKHASRLYPEELLLRLEEGKILLELERPEEALEAFKVCAPILRSDSDILVLASALLQGGYFQQSWELLEKRVPATKSGPLLTVAADALAALKRFSEAIEIYHRAIELGHANHRTINQLAHSYRRLGNLKQAEQIFRQLLEKDRGDIDATLGLGACMQERGHYQKALLVYQSGHAWEQKEPRLLKQAALCALYTKRFSHAERYFYDLMEMEKTSAPILAYYGYSLECQQKWQEAEQVYLQMIKLFPSYTSGYRALGWMFGVGLTTTLENAQGLNFAYVAHRMSADTTSWDILSACEARVGNFDKAYQIQVSLLNNEQNRECRIRRQEALRQLRKNHPLDNNHIVRSLVA